LEDCEWYHITCTARRHAHPFTQITHRHSIAQHSTTSHTSHIHHTCTTTHHAPRTTHHAPRTTHHAPRTTHHSPPHRSPLLTHSLLRSSVEYQRATSSNACDYCGHLPTRHKPSQSSTSSPSPSPAPTFTPSTTVKPTPASASASSAKAPAQAPAKTPAQAPYVKTESHAPTHATAVSSRPAAEKPMKNPAEWFKDKTKKKKA
jgi:hypothetical protein